MDKIRELCRLKHNLNLSNRAIARALQISHPIVREYLTKLKAAGIELAEVERLDDDALLAAIVGERKQQNERYQALAAQFEYIHTELKRTGVTLERLWREYQEKHPDGYGYSQFCRHFQHWRGTLDISMHLEHKAGDKLFVDFTGKKLEFIDKHTGEVKEAEVFVAILGASQYTYVEAVASQKKRDWIRANENALHFFGGAPKAIVPDCLKSAVQKVCKYEPDINPEYADFARYYGLVVLPARPAHPKDKALVEGAVNLVYQRIFAELRHRIFYSLNELNQAIGNALQAHNERPMQQRSLSRKAFFEKTERDLLSPLPKERYAHPCFSHQKAHINYHIYLREDKHYYSLPSRLRKHPVLVVWTDKVVEIFHKHRRVAWHYRDRTPGGYTTVPDHMPSSHRAFAEWTPQRLIDQAGRVSPTVQRVVELVLAQKQHPEQGFKSCQGIIHLADRFPVERVDMACQRALELGCCSFKGIENILKNRLEARQPDLFDTLPEHDNIRGAQYYRSDTPPNTETGQSQDERNRS